MKKIEYEKPQLIDLDVKGPPHVASGVCETGSGDSRCYSGNAAVDYCITGTSAGGYCQPGSSAGGYCQNGTGDSNYCVSGSSPGGWCNTGTSIRDVVCVSGSFAQYSY